MDSDYCYISKAKRGGILIEGKYNPEFVELIKEHVPADHRGWDPELKTWWVSPQYARIATIDANACYNEVIEI